MSAAAFLSSLSPRRLAGPALATALLALALVQVPTAMDVDAGSAHRALLYENLRLGRDWFTACPTVEGPLAALQTPAYLGGSIWMALAWQVAGNLLLAGFLVAAAWRLPFARRVWALAALAGVLARWPQFAPWLVIVLLGHDLVRRWDREPAALLPAAGLMGFLALASLGHLLLGLLALGLVAATARPPLAKVLAAAGFAAGLFLGWLALGQSPGALGRWLAGGLPLLRQTSPTTRVEDLAPLVPWAVAAGLGLLAALFLSHRAATPAARSLPAALFLGGAAWLAWRTLALPDHGLAPTFFATVLLAGFLLWHHGQSARWAGIVALLAVAGLAQAHPGFLPNLLGHFNRQVVIHWRELAAGPRLRSELRNQIGSLKAAHAWPKLQAAVGPSSVGAPDDALPRALYHGLALTFPATAWSGPAAPDFVITSFAAAPLLPPAFTPAGSSLALFRDYAVVNEENGFFLWHRLPAGTARPAPVTVASGSLAFGEPLRLPPAEPDTAYWLELEPAPGILGRLWALLAECPEPVLVTRDAAGATAGYALPPAAAARGFLVDPFLRGNADFQRWQRGASPVRTTEVTVNAPASGGWLWSGRCHYRLLALPNLALAGSRLPGPESVGFHAFSRRPVGTAYTLPFVESPPLPEDRRFFVHPSSLVEFAVTATDRRVRGTFGLAPGAYDRPGRTDGVDFAVEYLGLDGRRQVLLHRYLDPANETADRGFQSFDLALPPGPGGRLLLRTFNPAWRSAAWDWAFWRNVVIE